MHFEDLMALLSEQLGFRMNVLKKLTNIKAIIFDFDGVIVDSIEAKTNAFEQLYNRYGDDVKQKVKIITLEMRCQGLKN